MTAQPEHLQSLDADVLAYLELTEQMEQLDSQRGAIKARLAERGLGTHTTSSGVAVTVTAPSRRFNSTKAWSMLTPEQQALCTSPDAAKIKKQLAGVLVYECMEEGTGAPRVTIK